VGIQFITIRKFFPAAVVFAWVVAPAGAAFRPTVGLLVKDHSSEGFWGEVEKGAQEAADAFNVNLTIRGTMNAANSEAQIRLLESLVEQKIDALVITPSSSERLVEPLQAQAAKGLKIIVAESELSPALPLPFVGYDQAKFASEVGTIFASLLGENGRVAMFRGVSDQVVVQRDKIILSRLRQLRPQLNFYLDFFATGGETSTVAEKAALLLEKHPDSQLFIGTSSPATSALLAAAKNHRGTGPVRIAGFGFRLSPEVVDALEEGTLQAFICQMPREIGYKGVAAAAALIRGESVPPRTDISFLEVTKENLNTPAIQALKTR
jgi:ribose transport system substrate-binding protein